MSEATKKHLTIRSKFLIPLKNSREAQLLLKLFIRPLLKSLNMQEDERKGLDIIFGTDYRHILNATAQESFLMPGSLVFGSVIELPDNKQREVKSGDRFLVRIDTRTPNRIDIEQIRTGLVFLLTKRNYASIVNKLKGRKKCPVPLTLPFTD